MNTARARAYLGDGVYVAHDNFGVILTTEDGIRVTNTVYLEPEVWTALLRWHDAIATKALNEGTASK